MVTIEKASSLSVHAQMRMRTGANDIDDVLRRDCVCGLSNNCNGLVECRQDGAAITYACTSPPL